MNTDALAANITRMVTDALAAHHAAAGVAPDPVTGIRVLPPRTVPEVIPARPRPLPEWATPGLDRRCKCERCTTRRNARQ